MPRRAALDETPLATTGARLDALLAQVQACASANPWLEQRRAKVLLRIGQACERAGDWPAAERCTRNAPIRARATAASACTNA